MKQLKGLWLYCIILTAAFAFFAYSQLIGWKWLWATHTEPGENSSTRNHYRYMNHK